jgi:hypothetical protein
LAAVLVLHVVGIGWGLPASDGWDDDGIAPRDFLVGTALTYWPGQFFTYPPVHLLLLALLTLPASLIALARAPSLAAHDVIAEFIRVPYMTTFAIAARAVTLFMSIGIVATLASFAAEVRGRTAGYWVAATCGVNAVFTYYSHTTNLEVPYLFWSCLSLLFFARAMTRREPRKLRAAFAFAALAIGTKDQAYALYVLAVPPALAAWFLFDEVARRRRSEIAVEVGKGAAIALVLLLLIDGAVINPSGFAARLHFLTGPASQNHAEYAASLDGTMHLLFDTLGSFSRYYPLVFAPLALAGIAIAWRRGGSAGARAARLLPLFMAISFTLAFNCVARRTEHRFVLPQMLLVAVYAGFALDALIGWGKLRPALYSLVALAFAVALFHCAAVDAALLFDPRYDAEHWLRDHVHPNDVVETYGNNVYLPRFPNDARVTRVGPEPIGGRNPLPGVTDIEASYDEVDRRRPRFILVPDAWVWRYTKETEEPGRVISPQLAIWQKDVAARRFFRDLGEGMGPYRLAHSSQWQSAIWPRVNIHLSTGQGVRIYERDGCAANGTCGVPATP